MTRRAPGATQGSCRTQGRISSQRITSSRCQLLQWRGFMKSATTKNQLRGTALPLRARRGYERTGVQNILVSQAQGPQHRLRARDHIRSDCQDNPRNLDQQKLAAFDQVLNLNSPFSHLWYKNAGVFCLRAERSTKTGNSSFQTDYQYVPKDPVCPIWPQ